MKVAPLLERRVESIVVVNHVVECERAKVGTWPIRWEQSSPLNPGAEYNNGR